MAISDTQSPVGQDLDKLATLDGAVDLLSRLHQVPGAEEALSLYRNAHVKADGDAVQALITALTAIHQRLLAEASPDYWLPEIHITSDSGWPDQMDLAVDAAASRLVDAAHVALLLERVTTSVDDHSAAVPNVSSIAADQGLAL